MRNLDRVAMPLLPQMAHPVMHVALGYWSSIAPALDMLPGRQHVDPARIPRLLPYAWLLDVEGPVVPRQLPSLRYRLAGSHIDAIDGRTKRGVFLADLEPGFAADPRQHDAYMSAIQTGQAQYHHGPPYFAHQALASQLERLILPLASDGRQIDMLLGFTLFYASDGSELPLML